MSFFECLVNNNCAYSMVANYLSAIKASLVLHGLSYDLLDNPKLKPFQKSMIYKNPLSLVSLNIIGLPRDEEIFVTCDGFICGQVMGSVFLTGFFWFLRLSNFL